MRRGRPIDVEKILGGLKDFQRRSVDYVFERLYGEGSTRRFLLADEVGLGKTLVARGVVARAVEHLRREGVERIDVIYICSNGDIARQNINRLNVTGRDDHRLASRITLLPAHIRDLKQNELNFVSFTPGTSFKLGWQTGVVRERWLLYWLLRRAWPEVARGSAAKNLFQGHASKERFRRMIRELDPDSVIDAGLGQDFLDSVVRADRAARDEGRPGYRRRFAELCGRFHYARKHVPKEDRRDAARFISDLRGLLAASCIHALEPDLVILDEFQRFKHLLRPEDPAGRLARHLFSFEDVRVLLLSATPYKMYTLSHEAAEDDHYADFLETLRFLLDDPEAASRVQASLESFRRGTYLVAHDGGRLLQIVKNELEQQLRGVIARTERLAVTSDRSGMLTESTALRPKLDPRDVRTCVTWQRIARELGQPDPIEYWKSAPYLLNFMESYQLKQRFTKAVEQGADGPLAEHLGATPGALLSWKDWRAYREVDPGNATLRALVEQTLDRGWWRLLWVPPSLPYYRLDGPFAEVEAGSVTKRLIFSCWHVVPRAVSILLSYEAERQMLRLFETEPENTPEARKRRSPLLTLTRSEGRLTGMPVLGLMYPSWVLAEIGDHRGVAPEGTDPGPVTLDAVLDTVERGVRERLDPVIRECRRIDGPEDESWYWAAPILLDRIARRGKTQAWFENVEALAAAWADADADGGGRIWREHLDEARRVAAGAWRPGGRPPEDLSRVLAMLAVAGPGVCALRALAGVCGGPALVGRTRVRQAAARLAWAFRSLFNVPEVMALIRGLDGREPYWRRVLEYAARGGLQAVLDEYLHVLKDMTGLVDTTPDDAAGKLADEAAQAISLRSATPVLDRVDLDGGSARVRLSRHRARGRFALRFGEEKTEEGAVAFRADQVRAAFNSPFWPFVMATTSIGQEGLDFHPYCHAVIHWNLPSNPVDLEQREGRVHRFKGHAVRKNLAAQYGDALRGARAVADPWRWLFDRALSEPDRGSDLTPFWVYPLAGGATIERHVPALPLSREWFRLPALRRSLAVYRMVFGQPRQEDLVDYLIRHVDRNRLATMIDEFRIDLTPTEVTPRSESRAIERNKNPRPPT